jgi:diguanylate cyclase (GGDEF)-like protein
VWSNPVPVLVYVLAVDTLAAGVIAAATLQATGSTGSTGSTGTPTGLAGAVTGTDLVRLLVLVLGSAVHVEAARGIERRRELLAEGVSYANLKGMWTFAGAVVLPLPLAAVLIATTYAHSWCRLRRVTPHRWVFSAASVRLSAATAAVLLDAIAPAGHGASGAGEGGFPSGPLGLLALMVAGLAYWFLNYAMVIVAMLLSSPNATAGQVLGRLSDQLIVAGSLGLGVATAALLIHEPWIVAVLVVTVLGLHYGLLAGQFETASQLDAKTRLLNPVWWNELATKQLARAKRTGQSVGLIFVDMDHFKHVNDTCGHLAGDQVLKTIAAALKRETRADDLLCRHGGEEFAVLLPDVDPAELAHAAERLRRLVAGQVITVDTDRGKITLDQLSCSVGTAIYPQDGTELDTLTLAADTAMYAAKAAGRNTVKHAPATPGISGISGVDDHGRDG